MNRIILRIFSLFTCIILTLYIFTVKVSKENIKVPCLLEWDVVSRKMAWNVVILLGGGFALAEACKVSIQSIGIKMEPWGTLRVHGLLVVRTPADGVNEADTSTKKLPVLATRQCVKVKRKEN